MRESYVSEEDIAAVAELGQHGIRLYAVPVHAVYYVLAKSAADATAEVERGDCNPPDPVNGVAELVEDVPLCPASAMWRGRVPWPSYPLYTAGVAVPDLTVDQWGAAYAELTRRAVK